MIVLVSLRVLYPDGEMIRQRAHHGNRQGRLDPLMGKLPKRRDNDLPLDQLELFVLADDAGIDHARDVVHGERPAREPFGSGGGGNVHLLRSMATQL